MMPMMKEVLLAISSSPAASILAKVTVTTALALAGTQLARKSRAAARHVVLAAAFAVLVVLPIAAIVAPPVRVEVPIAAQKTAPSSVEATIDAITPAAPADAVGGAPAIARSSGLSLSALFLAGWSAGTVLFLAPVIVGLWQLRSLRRLGLPWRQGRSVVDALALDADVHRRVEVLLNESMPGPMTFGVLHPTIVLPLDAQTWAEEDLRRAIVHELEHVRRSDWVSQCVARAVCACYWFHPLVWVAWRQLALEAERACDDAVLRRAEATGYADQLVALAQRLSTATKPPLLAMANRAWSPCSTAVSGAAVQAPVGCVSRLPRRLCSSRRFRPSTSSPGRKHQRAGRNLLPTRGHLTWRRSRRAKMTRPPTAKGGRNTRSRRAGPVFSA